MELKDKHINQQFLHFTEAAQLQAFIDLNWEMLIGHKFERFYCAACFYTFCSEDQWGFVILDNMCLGFRTFEDSTLDLIIADNADFSVENEVHNDTGDVSVVFHSKLPEISDLYLDWCSIAPGMGQTVTDVSIERFSGPVHESYSDKIVRPAGGDYFRKVCFELTDKSRFCILADSYDYTLFSFENFNGYKYIHEMLNAEEVWIYAFNYIWDILQVSNLTEEQMGRLLTNFLRNQLVNKNPCNVDQLIYNFTSFGLQLSYEDQFGCSVEKYVEAIEEQTRKYYESLV